LRLLYLEQHRAAKIVPHVDDEPVAADAQHRAAGEGNRNHREG
jgi:hypothetical protein